MGKRVGSLFTASPAQPSWHPNHDAETQGPGQSVWISYVCEMSSVSNSIKFDDYCISISCSSSDGALHTVGIQRVCTEIKDKKSKKGDRISV